MSSSPSVPSQGLRTICLLLILLGLFAAGVGLWQRIHAENASKAVDVVVDYNEMVALAGQQGMPLAQVLGAMKAHGATAVALQEETLDGLQDQGAVVLQADPSGYASSMTYPAGWKPTDQIFAITASDYPGQQFVLNGLRRVYPAQNIAPSTRVGQILVRGAIPAMRDLGLGLSPDKVAQITASGLRVVPRLRGGTGITPASLAAALGVVAEQIGVGGIVVFDGTMLPGYRNLIPLLADELSTRGLVYGAVEFAKQKGDQQLGAKLQGCLVRVHSISPEELTTLAPAEAVQRFALAVKDRNIRVLYVHLPQLAYANALTDGTAYVQAITHEIAAEGYPSAVKRSARPFPAFRPAPPLLALIFAGAGAGFLLWLLVLLPAQLPRVTHRVFTVLLVLLGVGLLGVATLGLLGVAKYETLITLGRIKFGLLAAIAFPLLGLTVAYRRIERLLAERPRHVLSAAIVLLLGCTVVTLGGALLIAAMMAETRFLVKVGQFTGVKLTLALPLLIMGTVIITDGVARAGETMDAYLARIRARLRSFLAQPVYLWGVVAAIIGLVAVALLLARSGNDGGVGVSDVELKIRATLEQWLIARPRTKEFLIGHPMFLWAMAAAARGYRPAAMLLLLGATIGQSDILNTYCHAHTPVLLSVLRTANGLWLGIGIAAILLWLFGRRLRPASAEERTELA